MKPTIMSGTALSQKCVKFSPLASRLGVRVLIETVWNGFCESPDKFRDYLDAFDNPWVGAYFDIGNMQKFAPAEEWIRTLGHRTVKLDIKDWGKKNGFCRLGEGDVDWDKVRAALKEAGFSGWATREGSDKSIEDTSSLIDQLMIGKEGISKIAAPPTTLPAPVYTFRMERKSLPFCYDR